MKSRGNFHFHFLGDTLSLIAQVTIEESAETVETINEVEVTVETTEEEQKPVEPEDLTVYHMAKETIEEYEETQAAFRELWEKKREKVRVV
jgi:homoserine kinase